MTLNGITGNIDDTLFRINGPNVGFVIDDQQRDLLHESLTLVIGLARKIVNPAKEIF